MRRIRRTFVIFSEAQQLQNVQDLSLKENVYENSLLKFKLYFFLFTKYIEVQQSISLQLFRLRQVSSEQNIQ